MRKDDVLKNMRYENLGWKIPEARISVIVSSKSVSYQDRRSSPLDIATNTSSKYRSLRIANGKL